MFHSPKELLDKIALGEHSYLEIKEVRFAADRVAGPTRDALADELAGFANARGGVCVLGVADATREVVGISIDKLDIVEAFVREVCNDSITTARRQLNDLPDDLWTRVKIEFYKDAPDAVFKALLD